MRDHYDFERMPSRRNPFTRYLKQPVTMRIDQDSLAYFKALAEDTGIPYQTLINLYLRDCVVNQRRPRLDWIDGEVAETAGPSDAIAEPDR